VFNRFTQNKILESKMHLDNKDVQLCAGTSVQGMVSRISKRVISFCPAAPPRLAFHASALPTAIDRSPPFVIRRAQRNPMSSGEQRADKLRGV
jgi:hypothetical protein